MKLAKVKIEYSSGTTIVDRVSLDPLTGRVYLAPRVLGLMKTMEQSDVLHRLVSSTRALCCR
jgi:hypothetical protein